MARGKYRKQYDFMNPPNVDDLEKQVFDRSEFNMGSYNFIRYNNLLTILDECSVRCLSYSNTNREYERYVHLYYSTLKTLYNNLKGAMIDPAIEHFEDQFNRADEERKRIIETQTAMTGDEEQGIPIGFISLLEEIHVDLITVMQRALNLGFPVQRVSSFREKAERMLLGRSGEK